MTVNHPTLIPANVAQAEAEAPRVLYVLNEADIEAIAELAHETNRIYCQGIGDTEVPSWPEASDEQRNSMVMGVKYIVDDPLLTPAAQHAAWMKAKVDAGWTLGKKKNEETKTHPCLVPYEDLPAKQRIKDTLFHVVVRNAIGAITNACDNLIDQYLGPKGRPVLSFYRDGTMSAENLQIMPSPETAEIPPLGPLTIEQARALPECAYTAGEPYSPPDSREISAFKAEDGTTRLVLQLDDGTLAQARAQD